MVVIAIFPHPHPINLQAHSDIRLVGPVLVAANQDCIHRNNSYPDMRCVWSYVYAPVETTIHNRFAYLYSDHFLLGSALVYLPGVDQPLGCKL